MNILVVIVNITNMFTSTPKNQEFSSRAGRSKKVLKQAGVVHSSKLIKTVVSLLCMPSQKEMNCIIKFYFDACMFVHVATTTRWKFIIFDVLVNVYVYFLWLSVFVVQYKQKICASPGNLHKLLFDYGKYIYIMHLSMKGGWYSDVCWYSSFKFPSTIKSWSKLELKSSSAIAEWKYDTLYHRNNHNVLCYKLLIYTTVFTN